MRLLPDGLVRLACQRHLRDLQRSDIEWCPEIGDAFVGFISHLGHIKGRWGKAHYGRGGTCQEF